MEAPRDRTREKFPGNHFLGTFKKEITDLKNARKIKLMKIIFKIAKTELQKLFFSPVAWLILIIFCIQCAIKFTGQFEEIVRDQQLGYHMTRITDGIFSSPFWGLFSPVLSYLYLYIPLLTMGVMSQEISSGSIKLLYSSPVTNKQIIFGKYLALVMFGLVMISVLGVFCMYGALTINHVDLPLILCGLLGIFLLICAYAAIGLFMSSVTSYAVVAAMGTLGILALLNYIKGLGQSVEFIRDITYWVGITGRANTFVSGMITSEDVLYFLIVICLFLVLTLLRLQSFRQKINKMILTCKYLGVILAALMIGFLSSLPVFKSYLDVTNNKINTLTKASQDVVSKLKDGLTITTYVNMLDPGYWYALPVSFKEDQERFEQYVRFKPDIKMKYVYYYHKAVNDFLDKQYPRLTDKQRIDTLIKLNNYKFDIVPYSAIAAKVDLAPEKFRFVRLLETDKGKKTFLRIYDDNARLPSEREITAAFKRLTATLPTVGFVTGQGERESTNTFDSGYDMVAREKTFRYAFINQGFDFQNIALDKPVPDLIRILVLGDIHNNFSTQQRAYLNDYIRRGGNMIILGEPGRQDLINPVLQQFGAKFLPGTIIKRSRQFQPGLLVINPTNAAASFSFYLSDMLKYKFSLTMPGAAAIQIEKNSGFQSTTLFAADSVTMASNPDDTAKSISVSGLNQNIGTYPTVVALSRKVNKKTQKIIIAGDADWLDNSELLMSRNGISSGNYYLVSAAFYWLSDNEAPIDMRRDPGPDTTVKVDLKNWATADLFLEWLFAFLLIITALLTWLRRRGR
jgi:ABC-2 type transport system permease protein